MNALTCTVSINKKSVTLFPVQLSIYRQCKIVKAMDSSNRNFYLFFIRNHFFHAAHLKEVASDSMLGRMLAEGITFSGSHPLIEALIPDHSMLHSIPVQLLPKKLFAKYGPLDSALFLTFFDGRLPTENLRMQLKKVFYHFRRNGQLFAAFKLLHYYLDFAPDDPFASDMLSNLAFHPYTKRYQGTSILSIDDNAFLEFYCFERLQETDLLTTLLSIYKEEDRWVDELAVRSYYLSIHHNHDNLQSIQTLILRHFNENQQTFFFQELLSSIPHADELRDSIFQQLIDQHNHLKTIHFLVQEHPEVVKEQLPFVTESFLTVELDELTSLTDKTNVLLLELYQSDSETLEKIVSRFVFSMLHTRKLNDVKNWLKVFDEANIKLVISGMIDKMEVYQEDPDQQFELGKLYLYFNQYEQAIDCFKWEMELKPYAAEPIQHLIKVYASLDNKEELKTYKQLLHQVNKNSGMIDQI